MLVTNAKLAMFRKFDNSTDYTMLSADRQTKYVVTKEQYDLIRSGEAQITLALTEKIGEPYTVTDSVTGEVKTGARKYNKFACTEVDSLGDAEFTLRKATLNFNTAKLDAERKGLGI